MIYYTQLTIIFMVGAFLQGAFSGLGAIQKSHATDDYLSAQAQENQKNREFNFMLAKTQNEWNLQQWERSNEYNNPLNQMNRLKQAGLNPNLVYGNGAGQSVAAPNPQLTAGQPSTPQDLSLMTQRPTVGQVMSEALQNRAVQAQIEKTEADTRKTLADAGISENDLKYRDAFNAIGLSIQTHEDNLKSQQAAAFVEEFEKLKIERQQASYALKGMKLDVFRKKIENAFREKEMEHILKKLENEAKISEQEAKFALENYANRLLLSSSEAAISADQAAIPKWLEDIKDKNQAGLIGATLLQGVRYILGFINPF